MAPTDKLIGKTIGPYRVERRLGRGGMGTVYLAVGPDGAHVALKVLHEDLGYDEGQVERFRREAEAGARLTHPAILRTLTAGQAASNVYYFAMEFFRGRNVEELIAEYGPLSERQALVIAYRVATGLEYAHRRGVLHRDVKPANIMVSPEGEVRLTDFGIAKAVGDQRLTRTGTVVGTPAYCPPEQLQGKELDGRADVYALGIALYEMLTGYVPYDGDSAFDIMRSVLVDTPRPITDFRRDITADTVGLVESMTERHLDRRIGFASAVVDALEDRVRQYLVAARTPTGFDEALRIEARQVFEGVGTMGPTRDMQAGIKRRTGIGGTATPTTPTTPSPRPVTAESVAVSPVAPTVARGRSLSESPTVANVERTLPGAPPRATGATGAAPAARHGIHWKPTLIGGGAAALLLAVWITRADVRLGTPLFLGLAASGQPTLHNAGERGLAMLGTRAVPVLVRRLETSGDPASRAAIYGALGRLDAPEATEALLAGMSDDSPRCRAAALAGLRDRPLSETDRRGLCVQALDDPDSTVRTAALDLIAGDPDPAYLPALVRAYDGADATLRTQLNATLEGYGSAALPHLAAAYAGLGQNGKRAIIEAIKTVGGPAAIRVLLDKLSEPEYAVRFFIVEALESLTGQKLGDDPAAWRSWAARELPAA